MRRDGEGEVGFLNPIEWNEIGKRHSGRRFPCQAGKSREVFCFLPRNRHDLTNNFHRDQAVAPIPSSRLAGKKFSLLGGLAGKEQGNGATAARELCSVATRLPPCTRREKTETEHNLRAPARELKIDAFITAIILGEYDNFVVNEMRDLTQATRAVPGARLRLYRGSQPKLWTDMRVLHGSGLERLIVDALVKELDLRNTQVVQTALANPLDKFELGIRKLIEDLMIERMGENDKIVTRYMADHDFQSSSFPILAREIFETIRGRLSAYTAAPPPCPSPACGGGTENGAQARW